MSGTAFISVLPPIFVKSVSSMSTEPPLLIFFGGLGDAVSSLVVRFNAAIPLGELTTAAAVTEDLRSDLSFQCSSAGRYVTNCFRFLDQQLYVKSDQNL